MKQKGIVDRFEGERVLVEIDGQIVEFDKAAAPPMLGEGMVVYIEDGKITEIDQIETQRIEDDMRRRFERILGKKEEF